MVQRPNDEPLGDIVNIQQWDKAKQFKVILRTRELMTSDPVYRKLVSHRPRVSSTT